MELKKIRVYPEIIFEMHNQFRIYLVEIYNWKNIRVSHQ